MAQEIYGVKPGSDDYSHEIVLKARGKRYGLKLLRGTSSLHVIPPRRQAPPMTLEQASFHRGRGAETWTQNTASVYDTHNAWDGTPNKLHPTLLMQWTTGMRDAEMMSVVVLQSFWRRVHSQPLRVEEQVRQMTEAEAKMISDWRAAHPGELAIRPSGCPVRDWIE